MNSSAIDESSSRSSASTSDSYVSSSEDEEDEPAFSMGQSLDIAETWGNRGKGQRSWAAPGGSSRSRKSNRKSNSSNRGKQSPRSRRSNRKSNSSNREKHSHSRSSRRVASAARSANTSNHTASQAGQHSDSVDNSSSDDSPVSTVQPPALSTMACNQGASTASASALRTTSTSVASARKTNYDDYDGSSGSEEMHEGQKTDDDFEQQVTHICRNTGLTNDAATRLLLTTRQQNTRGENVDAVAFYFHLQFSIRYKFPGLSAEDTRALLERSRFHEDMAENVMLDLISAVQQNLPGVLQAETNQAQILSAISQHSFDPHSAVNSLVRMHVTGLSDTLGIDEQEASRMLSENNWSFTDAYNASTHQVQDDEQIRVQEETRQDAQASSGRVLRSKRKAPEDIGGSNQSTSNKQKSRKLKKKKVKKVKKSKWLKQPNKPRWPRCNICSESIDGSDELKQSAKVCGRETSCDELEGESKKYCCLGCRRGLLEMAHNNGVGAICPFCNGPFF